jgi:hypothetical protein
MKTENGNTRGAWTLAMLLGGVANWMIGGDALTSMLFAAILAALFMPRD